MALSRQAASVVEARLKGTKLNLAEDSELELMWNHVIFRLGVKVAPKDLNTHVFELSVLNDWILQHYGSRLTTEEVKVAYDLACTQKLAIEELFSILSPKHVGIVLESYLRYTKEDLEINRVFTQQLLIENEKEQTPEEINAFMESALKQAKEEVDAGKFYFDAGNGLFDWLLLNGRITIDEDQADHFYNKAKQQLPNLLDREKSNVTPGDTGKRSQLEKLIEQLEMGKFGNDHEARVQSYAKRLFLNHYLKTLSNEEK
ncbi:hypothetical protein GJR95_15435 [Spirosoma endbachense]|uniref:Uncharacterized protein n=2 Tax=Spirosoma endbachense TaxID=2666025 RepID=A0A6P1VY59_9BACT|nr:hypothetical protein GJR95_15435 [Spirosoma endbachense]